MKIHVRTIYLHGFGFGDSDRNRTHNLQICNLLHYQLCYTVMFVKAQRLRQHRKRKVATPKYNIITWMDWFCLPKSKPSFCVCSNYEFCGDVVEPYKYLLI